ncbi:hypothetical protein STIAU_1673 [Stigmatella aurantiaca DW4/3-1]|uniref:Uncharacterized protein n=1 Tax=Stigmatella aurantiaca (strain DW4/3-1) TaxID=378806 RepID=Q095M9_STIAD|nr:hypothetical protein STIAU_1673 [Stigmatella aurantiaca DW4/3-1]
MSGGGRAFRSAAREPHGDARLGGHEEPRDEPGLIPGLAVQPEPLQQHRDDHLRLGPGEVRANTDSRSGAKGEIGEPVPPLGALRAKPLGLEVVRVRPEPGIAVERPLAHEDVGARGNHIVVVLQLPDGGAAHGEGRGVDAQGLFEAPPGVVQLGQVFVRDHAAIAEDGVPLLVHPLQRLGVLGQQIEREGEAVRRGVMSRQEEVHELVTELLVAHPLARLLVHGAHVHREQILAVVVPALPPLGDDAVDDGVQGAPGLLILAVLPGGDELGQGHHRPQQVDRIALQDIEVLDDFIRARADVRREQTEQHDAERQALHLPGDVDRLSGACLPFDDGLRDRLLHDAFEGGDAGAAEGRVGHPPLALPGVARQGREPCADGGAQLLHDLGALGEILLRVQQDGLHQLWLGDEIGIHPWHVDDVSIVPGEAADEGQGIAQHLGSDPQEWPSLRSGNLRRSGLHVSSLLLKQGLGWSSRFGIAPRVLGSAAREDARSLIHGEEVDGERHVQGADIMPPSRGQEDHFSRPELAIDVPGVAQLGELLEVRSADIDITRLVEGIAIHAARVQEARLVRGKEPQVLAAPYLGKEVVDEIPVHVGDRPGRAQPELGPDEGFRTEEGRVLDELHEAGVQGVGGEVGWKLTGRQRRGIEQDRVDVLAQGHLHVRASGGGALLGRGGPGRLGGRLRARGPHEDGHGKLTESVPEGVRRERRRPPTLHGPLDDDGLAARGEVALELFPREILHALDLGHVVELAP